LIAALISACLPLSLAEREFVPASSDKRVVLLHGLARSSLSMAPLQHALTKHGYTTCNIDYPSRQFDIDALARLYVLPAIRACFDRPDETLDFVTHSMGGILLRYLVQKEMLSRVGRVVMLGPPNGGSEVVDRLGGWPAFDWINGPAGLQLGRADDSLPSSLGAATFELGVIAGNRSINWILSMLINGIDDGKVSIDSAQLDGMRDFLVLPTSHPFIMKNTRAIEQTLHFLQHGQFDKHN
jgi:pimeloyl-ACP methyl ester carboxylesterase